jgi:hypothetical protein
LYQNNKPVIELNFAIGDFDQSKVAILEEADENDNLERETDQRINDNILMQKIIASKNLEDDDEENEVNDDDL